MPKPCQPNPIHSRARRLTVAETQAVPRGRSVRSRRILAPLAVVALLGVGIAACSGDGDDASSVAATGTTETTAGAAGDAASPAEPPATSADGGLTTTSSAPGSAEPDPEAEPATTLPQASAVDVTTAVYWVRPAGDDGPRSVPGYQDPDTGPFPLLVYGSAVNDGATPVDDPVAAVLWRTASGEVRFTTVAVLRTPSGAAIATLEPGQSADVHAVVTGDTAGTYGDLSPEIVVAAR